MRALGNIIWHIPFLGFVNAIFCYLIGLILLLTVVGAPLGRGLMELGKFMFTPFTSSMVHRKDLNVDTNKGWKAYGLIIRIIYFPFGLFLACAAVFQIAGMFISIVGIPVALVVAKSLSTYFNPVGKKCVPRAVKNEIESRKTQNQIDKHL